MASQQELSERGKAKPLVVAGHIKGGHVVAYAGKISKGGQKS